VTSPPPAYLFAIGESFARILAPHGEVVLHDVETDTISAIWNPLSRRVVGEPSLLAELDLAAGDVFGPYPKTLADGRALSSVSAVVRDDSGAASMVLCVNVDRTAFEAAARLLAAFAAPVALQPRALFEKDWVEGLNDLVGAYVRESGRSVDRFTRDDRLEVLARMDAAGVFGRQKAAQTVARTLEVSRSGLYTLLAELRKEATP
jgi:predicted transcriptional regulator YheO